MRDFPQSKLINSYTLDTFMEDDTKSLLPSLLSDNRGFYLHLDFMNERRDFFLFVTPTSVLLEFSPDYTILNTKIRRSQIFDFLTTNIGLEHIKNNFKTQDIKYIGYTSIADGYWTVARK